MDMSRSIGLSKRSVIKKLKELDSALKSSFSNLKCDMVKISNHLIDLDSRINEQNNQLRELKKEIDSLRDKEISIDTIKENLKKEILQDLRASQKSNNSTRESPDEAFGNRSVKSTERSVSVRRTPNTTGFTGLHMEMLKRLMVLQIESGKRGVSLRRLADELYPHKRYSSIKSTLSEYIKKLNQAGFVEKKKRGKLYVSYTEKALQFADSQRINRMKELISKPL